MERGIEREMEILTCHYYRTLTENKKFNEGLEITSVVYTSPPKAAHFSLEK